MKTSTLFIIGFFTFTFITAQEIEKPSDVLKKHEISIDFFESLLGKYEASYDYILNDNASVGATISISPDFSYIDYFEHEKFSFKANYKFYFSKKRAQGFYVELFSEVAAGNRFKYANYGLDLNDSTPYTDLNLGFNLGYKYVNKQNYFINVSTGLSRTITSFHTDSNYYSSGIKPNFTLSIGKRF